MLYGCHHYMLQIVNTTHADLMQFHIHDVHQLCLFSAGMLADKRMDVDKHVLNMDYNGVIGKSPGPRHHISKESSMDRSPYFDKVRSRRVSEIRSTFNFRL